MRVWTFAHFTRVSRIWKLRYRNWMGVPKSHKTSRNCYHLLVSKTA